MEAWWIWLAAVVVYVAFRAWYDSWRGPLRSEEVETYLERLGAGPEATPERLASIRAFLASDDGREFWMVNLIRLHPEPAVDPQTGERVPARALLERYTRPFVRALLRRAGHPALLADVAGSYMDAWSVEPDPGWSFVGVMRYRSRRDMMELATAADFPSSHAFKIAAMANTLAFPVVRLRFALGPRTWVAALLALAAAFAQLALRAG